jgi:S1-C subfamily serine protease
MSDEHDGYEVPASPGGWPLPTGQTPPPAAGPPAVWGTGWPPPPGALPDPGALGPGGSAWLPPGAPAPSPRRRRRGLLAASGALAVAVAAVAGVTVGHVVWPSSASASSTGRGVVVTPGNGSGGSGGTYQGQSPYGSGGSFGDGSPFGSGGSFGGSSGGNTSEGSGGPSDVGSIAAKVDPALVDVNSTFNYQSAQGAGTGIVLTSNGVILTNNHVINEATSISVTDVGNGKTYSATVVGYDESRDIAVLQLHGASGLQTADIGDSSTAAVGESVVAVGNAGGTGGTPTSAGGSITALDQSISAADDLDGTSEQLSGLIETNADVQAGDSGGSLVTNSGQVIGVDAAASEGTSFQSSGNQGYAIPINEALSIARQIENGQGSSDIHVGSTAELGVLLSTSDEQSDGGGFGSGFGSFGGVGGGDANSGGSSTTGADVSGVVSGSAAQQAGLADGDVITSFDGQSVGSITALSQLLITHHPGDTVQVGWVDSSGQSHTATVDLGSGPPA